MWTFYLVICLLLLCKGTYGGQGECCRAYTSSSGSYHSAQYCSNYCCDDTSLSTFFSGSRDLECCNSFLRETSSLNRNNACINWWTDTSWAIPVVVIGNLAILVGCIVCCVCCVKGCTNNNNRSGTVFVQQPQQAGMAMVTASSQQQQQQQQMGGGGYGYPPPGNNGVQPASYGNNVYGNQPQPSASNGAFVAPPPYPEKGGPV